MLELHALGQFLRLATQAGLLFGRVFATDLDVGQHADGVALDRVQQLLNRVKDSRLYSCFGFFCA